VYGEGIDKFNEIMELADEFELGRKYGQTYTFDGIKYPLEEFKQRLREECDFFDEIKTSIISKIQQLEIEEEIIEEEEELQCPEQEDDNQLTLL
jgi:uncharacterized protein (UPF0128 family)